MEKQEVARLYDRYAQDVFRLALSYLYNRPDAEDVCHCVDPCGKRHHSLSRAGKGMAAEMRRQCLQGSAEILLEAKPGGAEGEHGLLGQAGSGALGGGRYPSTKIPCCQTSILL